MKITPRPYQATGIAEIRQSFADGHKATLYVLPTGGGKTVTFSVVTQKTAERKKVVWILVHRIELLRQAYRDITALGIDAGLINAKYSPSYHNAVQIASVQTLVNRMHLYPKPDLIIIDEAHHSTAGTWRKIIETNPQAHVLGVTATPERGDGTGLGRKWGGVFDDLIIGPQIYELIADAYLVKPRIKHPNTVIDLSAVKITDKGDYNSEQLAVVMDKPTITGDAVKYYQHYAHCQPAVAFCVNIQHAEHVAEQFREAGYRAQSVDGKMTDEQRKYILDGLANGRLHVVTSCDLISEGTDIPAIACAILLRPTQSLSLYLQQVGRALRPMYAKDYDLLTLEGRQSAIANGPKPNGALILDHVGNILLHGAPQEHREWTLEGVKRRKRMNGENEALLAKYDQCKECFAIYDPAPECPECGWQKPVKEAKAQPISVQDGELVDYVDRQSYAIEQARAMQVKEAKAWHALKKVADRLGKPQAWIEKKMEENRQRWERQKAVSLKPQGF